jgi:hypothetical protein
MKTRKKILQLWMCLFFPLFATANDTKDYLITIAVNIENCINCDKAIYDLAGMRDQYNIRFVLKEEYKEDSTRIIEQFNLRGVSQTILWSDSIYEEYSPYNISNVSVESKYRTGRFTLPVVELYRKGFFGFLQVQNKAVDTLFANEPKITVGMRSIKWGSNNLYSLVNSKNTIYVYDYLKQSLKDSIQFPESLLRQIFPNTGLPPKEFDAQMAAMKLAKVPQTINVADYMVRADTVFVYFSQQYFDYRGKDTFLRSRFTLLQYVGSKLVAQNKINHTLLNEDGSYYVTDGFLIPSKKDIYVNIDGRNPERANRKYLGQLRLNKQKVYEIDTSSSLPIPPVYTYSSDFLMVLADEGHYLLLLDNKIYDMEQKRAIDSFKLLDPLEGGYITADINPPQLLGGLRVSKDYYWVIRNEFTANSSKQVFLKVNRKTRQIQQSKIQIGPADSTIASYDPLNPDYIVYKTKKRQIIRQKIF